jgi:hypothetical protein
VLSMAACIIFANLQIELAKAVTVLRVGIYMLLAAQKLVRSFEWLMGCIRFDRSSQRTLCIQAPSAEGQEVDHYSSHWIAS